MGMGCRVAVGVGAGDFVTSAWMAGEAADIESEVVVLEFGSLVQARRIVAHAALHANLIRRFICEHYSTGLVCVARRETRDSGMSWLLLRQRAHLVLDVCEAPGIVWL